MFRLLRAFPSPACDPCGKWGHVGEGCHRSRASVSQNRLAFQRSTGRVGDKRCMLKPQQIRYSSLRNVPGLYVYALGVLLPMRGSKVLSSLHLRVRARSARMLIRGVMDRGNCACNTKISCPGRNDAGYFRFATSQFVPVTERISGSGHWEMSTLTFPQVKRWDCWVNRVPVKQLLRWPFCGCCQLRTAWSKDPSNLRVSHCWVSGKMNCGRFEDRESPSSIRIPQY